MTRIANLTTPACTAQFEHAPEAVSRPTNDVRLSAPLAAPHVDLTRPRAELLGRLFSNAELLFRNQPPFAGKVTPDTQADHYDQVPLLVRANAAARALDISADEAAQEFTRGCEESVRYARELADPALRALAETLERASGRERRADSGRTDAAGLERRVLERVRREADTPRCCPTCGREMEP